MPRGPRWTEAEDTAIERATFENLELGILESRPRGASTRARRLGRRYLAGSPGEPPPTYCSISSSEVGSISTTHRRDPE